MKNRIKMTFKPISLLVLLAGITISSSASSQDILGLAGYTGNTDQSHYGYVGLIAPLPVGQNTSGSLGNDGVLLRLWGAWLAYDYKSGAPSNTNIDVDGPIGEVGLGYHFVRDFAVSSVYVSYVGRSLDDSPNDPFNNSVDDHSGVKFQGDTTFDLSDQFGVNLNGSYTAILDDYWVRGRLYYKYNDTINIGPEITGLGGDKYHRVKFGAFISGIQLGGLSLGLQAGADRDTRDDTTDAYFGISLVHLFKY